MFFFIIENDSKHESKPLFDGIPRPNNAQNDVLNLIFEHLINKVHFFLSVARRSTQTASMLQVKSIVHFKKVAKIDGKPTVPQLPNINLLESTYVNEDSKCG